MHQQQAFGINSVEDIFNLWPSLPEFAIAVNAPIERAKKWKYRKRIPQEHWPGIVEAARAAGKALTTDHLLAAHNFRH